MNIHTATGRHQMAPFALLRPFGAERQLSVLGAKMGDAVGQLPKGSPERELIRMIASQISKNWNGNPKNTVTLDLLDLDQKLIDKLGRMPTDAEDRAIHTALFDTFAKAVGLTLTPHFTQSEAGNLIRGTLTARMPVH